MWKFMTGIGFFAVLIGLFTGGLIRRFLQPPFKIADMVTEFASGLFLALVCFGLLPEAFLIGGFQTSLPGILLGVLVMLLFRNLFAPMQKQTALFCILTGLAPGAVFISDAKLAASVILAILIAHIPQGIRSLAPEEPRIRTIGTVLFCSVMTAMGVLFGSLCAAGSGNTAAFLLGTAGGGLLYLCSGKLMGENRQSRIGAVMQMLGILAGLLLAI